MTREQVLPLMFKTRVIPLFYHSDAEIAQKLVATCYAGGARVIEFTNRGDEALEVFKNLSAYCKENFPDLAIGIGSIANVDQAEQFVLNGADFLVSPFIKKELADYANKLDILWAGGCGTITEMQTAYEWGAPLIKLFPGNIYGAEMIKGAKAPCPWLNIMPTGGVKPDKDNLSEWFLAGASCVGMGSQLFVKKANGEFDYEAIEKKLFLSIKIAQIY